MISKKLHNIESHAQEIRNEITNYNGHVKFIVETLSDRGETTNELLMNVLKGYGAFSDINFVDYIRKKTG